MVQSINKAIFTYTGSDQPFTVPDNVSEIMIKVWGAGGGGGNGNNPTFPGLSTGGAGGFVSGTLSVTPQEQFSIVVGEGGRGDGTPNSTTYGFGGNGSPNSQNGANGGGLSGVFEGHSPVLETDSARALFIAGGGGAGERGPTNWSIGGQGGDSVFGGGSATMQGGSTTTTDDGGGGGGGYQGGLANQIRITNDPEDTTHGEGGTNFIHPTVIAPINLATPDVAGPDQFSFTVHDPPQIDDVD